MAAQEEETDRVRRHTPDRYQQRIDRETEQRLRYYVGRDATEIDRRIRELDTEWDIERVLETNAATLALTGAVLGTTVDRKWFLLTGTVLGFLIQHAASGWCPPVPLFRKLGVRTQGEIDQEKMALKALRGDFRIAAEGADDVPAVLAAVRA